MKRFSILDKIRENQNKVAKLDSVLIPIMGMEQETDKAVKLLISKRGEYVSKWIPKSCLLSGGESNEIEVVGWFAAKELMGYVPKSYFA